MLKVILFLFFALLLACGANRASSTSQGNDSDVKGLEAEEYVIYSLLINQLYAQDSEASVIIDGQTRTYILPHTSIGDALQSVDERIPGRINKEVLADFITKNSTTRTLERRFSVKNEYVILNDEDMRLVFGSDKGWSEFLQRYPGRGLINFSRVAFNSQFNQALVYTSIESGGKSGRGYYIVLSKKVDGWSISHKVLAWVS